MSPQELPPVEGRPQAQAVRLLRERGQSVATAESLTAGLISASLAEVPGASAVLRGGVVSYAAEVKEALLGVDPELIAARGTVDPDVARAMARGARRACAADWGVSATGAAGPEPHDGKPVGTVYLGIAGPGEAETVLELHLTGDRERIRTESARRALETLVEQLSRGR